MRKHLSIRNLPLLINASRIGEIGGLRSFTEALVHCFDDSSKVSVVVPYGIRLHANVEQRTVPPWLASSSRVSSLRPILWWAYSALCFPAARAVRVLSSTHHVLPFRKHQVVTVHDIRPYYHQDSWVQGFYWRYLLPRALRKCDGILTVSETSKDLLVSVYAVLPERVYVVPNVVDSQFFRPASGSGPNGNPFILCVGSTWKHKNTTELLRMYPCWAPKFKLKIVGGEGQYSQLLRELAATLGIGDRVEFFSGLASNELLHLYQGCSALVFPSIMEGFGLPPLEAMSCGRPVIVSDSPLFRELYSDVPFYVKLGSVESWRQAFSDLDQYSSERAMRGRVHAEGFSKPRMRSAVQYALGEIWKDEIEQKGQGE